LILAMLKILNTKLRNSKCGKGKKNWFHPPTFNAKNRRLKAKKLALNHVQISMHKIEQFLLCLASYFWHESRRWSTKKKTPLNHALKFQVPCLEF
jgi:hypothetical protein